MNTLIIQATATEFIDMVRAAVSEEFERRDKTVKGDVTKISATKNEAAAILRVSLSTVNKLIKKNQLPAYYIGSKVFVKHTDIEAYLNKKG